MSRPSRPSRRSGSTPLPALLVGAALLALAVAIPACRSGSTSGDTVTDVSIPAMDPQCAAYLRAMCDTITASPNKHLRILDTWDEPDEFGERIQLSHVREFVIAAPDKMMGVTAGDTLQRSFWKDGETITLLDRNENIYARIPDPGSIDDMLDMLVLRYGVAIPNADFFSADPYDIFISSIDRGRYLGLHLAGDRPCHHMAFNAGGVDFQLWVDADGSARPRKFVITYHDLPGIPQFTSQLLTVETLASIPDSTFTFTSPTGAEEVQLLPLLDEGPR